MKFILSVSMLNPGHLALACVPASICDREDIHDYWNMMDGMFFE